MGDILANLTDVVSVDRVVIRSRILPCYLWSNCGIDVLPSIDKQEYI